MPPLADARARVRAHWRLKLVLSFCLTVFFMVPYFTLQHVVLVPMRALRTTPIDDAIGFDPRWVWIYQSVYLLIAVVPWLAVDRTHLTRYVRGFVSISLVGFACFLFFPIAGPRPDVTPTSGMYGWLTWYDRPTNEWPSLHIGLSGFTLLFGVRISESALDAVVRRRLLLVGAVWTSAIAYAAVATKQHYVVDLPAGLILAWLAHRWAWRDARVMAEAAPRPGVGDTAPATRPVAHAPPRTPETSNEGGTP